MKPILAVFDESFCRGRVALPGEEKREDVVLQGVSGWEWRVTFGGGNQP